MDRRAEPAQRCWPSSSTRRRLRTADRGSFSHIPSGIDAFSTTHLTHQLAVVPFLNHGPRAGLIALIGDPSNHVELVFAAHTHKFAYRIVNASGAHPVPILMVPAISPIFGNAPSFLTANVSPDGIVSGVLLLLIAADLPLMNRRARRVTSRPRRESHERLPVAEPSGPVNPRRHQCVERLRAPRQL